jgi:hypothetical protein
MIKTLNPNENTDSSTPIKKPILSTDTFFETKDTRSQSKQIFVISVDGIPNCYATTIENSRVKMRELAKDLIWKHFANYKSCIREQDNQNNIKVVGHSKEYLISYEQVLNNLKICEITLFY